MAIDHERTTTDPAYQTPMRRGQCLLSYSDEKYKDKDTETSNKNVLMYTGLGKTLATNMCFQAEFCQIAFQPLALHQTDLTLGILAMNMVTNDS